MKKIYLVLCLAFITLGVSAQVTVTYRVDITNYLGAGNVLGAGGMRVGGNFADQAVTSGQVNWSPSDPSCAMTDLGNNIWSIDVTYPATSVGLTQLYKFVNNDWGTNEGTDPNNTIATNGCGVDDGAGNVNRTLVIPAANVTYEFCFDACFQCDGSSPDVTGINNVTVSKGVAVGPNPFNDQLSFSYNLKSSTNVIVNIVNMIGETVASTDFGYQAYGSNRGDMNVSSLPAGTYFYVLTAGNDVAKGSIVKQ